MKSVFEVFDLKAAWKDAACFQSLTRGILIAGCVERWNADFQGRREQKTGDRFIYSAEHSRIYCYTLCKTHVLMDFFFVIDSISMNTVLRLASTGGPPMEVEPIDPRVQMESQWRRVTSLAQEALVILRRR